MPHGKRAPRTDGKPKGSALAKGKHPALTTKPADSPDKRGRPQIQIDEKSLYEIALTHASFEHMGRILGCSGQFLSVHPTYREIIMRARAVQKKDLLAAQFNTAIKDRNPTMQIWLGKQYLGQRDTQRVETSGPDGKPQQHEVTHGFGAVAYFPDNGRSQKGTPLPAGSATDNGEDVHAELIDPDDEREQFSGHFDDDLEEAQAKKLQRRLA